MRVVKKYPEAISAQIDSTLLDSEGIASEVLNENMSYAGYFAGSNFDIELVVADEDYDRAVEILSEAGSDAGYIVMDEI